MLKLMYITNRTEIARIAEAAGVDRIFVDMEYIGKAERQGGMDTVQCHHTPEDVGAIKDAVTKSEILVRINPIHEKTEAYISSQEEIDAVIEAGADLIMLPYFKTVEEVKTFVQMVGGRAKTIPLVETPEAVAVIDDILAIEGLDEVFVGLNDLSLGYGKKFMFELLCDGTIEALTYKFRQKKISFGFGGIAAPGKGMLPAEKIIAEHYHQGSTCVILSRSFCNTDQITNLDEIRKIFTIGVQAIREHEALAAVHSDFFARNYEEMQKGIEKILEAKR